MQTNANKRNENKSKRERETEKNEIKQSEMNTIYRKICK